VCTSELVRAGNIRPPARHGSALCISDHHDAPARWTVTAPHVYVRAHGPSGDYRDRYAPRTLAAWARWRSRLRKEGHSIYVYFDNDQKSAAPLDAARLMRLLRLS
jgi:uncharacterized protein YecE (DUF72 family)